MAYSLAQKLQSLGVATQLGEELEAQITAGVGNSLRLQELGITPEMGDYIESGIPAGENPINAVKLNRYGMVADVAKLLVKNINAPINTVVPAITGTAQVGQTLTRTTGTWTGSPAPTYVTAWLANDVVIPSATGTTYVPVIGDIGKTIKVRVTATNTSGSAVQTSAATAAVVAA